VPENRVVVAKAPHMSARKLGHIDGKLNKSGVRESRGVQTSPTGEEVGSSPTPHPANKRIYDKRNKF